MTARFPFLPQTVAGAAEENRFAGSLRLRKSLRVHEAEHQYFTRAAVLNNGGYQTAGLCECDFHGASSEHQAHKNKKPAGACCASGPMSTFSSESLRTTQRTRHVAVMMMMPMRPEMIQNAHLLRVRLAEPAPAVNPPNPPKKPIRRTHLLDSY
jgi:hypothetical protein